MRGSKVTSRAAICGPLLAGLIVLALVSPSASSSEATTPISTPSEGSLSQLIPQALCWEYQGGQLSAFWSYTNPSTPVNVTDTSKNAFYVNGALLDTSLPPTVFGTGDFPLAALITLNLGPNGLTLAWTLGERTSTMDGSASSHRCPNVSLTIDITTTSTPSNTSALPSLLASALSISASRITVSSTSSSTRSSLATLPITITPSETEISSILASYRLEQLLRENGQFVTDLSQTISSDVAGSTIDTSQISPALPQAAAPTKKGEMWVGTLMGIIFSSIFGTAIVAMLLTTFIFRFTAYLEEKRLNTLTERLLVPERPLIGPPIGEAHNKIIVQHEGD